MSRHSLLASGHKQKRDVSRAAAGVNLPSENLSPQLSGVRTKRTHTSLTRTHAHTHFSLQMWDARIQRTHKSHTHALLVSTVVGCPHPVADCSATTPTARTLTLTHTHSCLYSCGVSSPRGSSQRLGGSELRPRPAHAHITHTRTLFSTVVGCPHPAAPRSAWVERKSDRAVVRCNHTTETWYLTCRGNAWVGSVSNCTKGSYRCLFLIGTLEPWG